jgi:hypothetical protein
MYTRPSGMALIGYRKKIRRNSPASMESGWPSPQSNFIYDVTGLKDFEKHRISHAKRRGKIEHRIFQSRIRSLSC